MIRFAIAFLAVAAALVLSGCGIRGDLERPPPLWGDDNRPEAAADTSTSGGEDAEQAARD